MSKAVGSIAKIDYTNLYRYLASTGTVLVLLSYIGIFGYLTATYSFTQSTKTTHILLLGSPILVGIVMIVAAVRGIGQIDGWLSRQSTMDEKQEAQLDLYEKQSKAYEKMSTPQLPAEISNNMEDWSREQ